ncbi:MAG: leucine-rich repeat domain-containing protein [Candidatus Nomurabacteria bacterium]|nr:leucine-rich repeat domain-containing protein [Candidatus Nomurabacteria bacterium]
MAPDGTTPSSVTCTTPGPRGPSSCYVDASAIDSGLSGTIGFDFSGSAPAGEADIVSGSVTGSGTLAIPKSINVDGSGTIKTVTRMWQGGLSNSSTFSGTIIIPNTVQTIRDSAVGSAQNISTILFEDGGTAALTIDAGAFHSSKATNVVEFPGRLTYMGSGVFNYSAITGVIFNEGPYPLTLTQGAFTNTTDLTGAINFPANLNTVAAGAFHSDDDCQWFTPGQDTAIDTVKFLGDSITGVDNDAFKSGVKFITTCNANAAKTADIRFLKRDGSTTAHQENNFGCGAYVDQPSVSEAGYKLLGWHLRADLSDAALTFPWTPYAGATLVENLPVYGDYTPLEEVDVAVPKTSFVVGESVNVSVFAKYGDASRDDVTNASTPTITSKDTASGQADNVSGTKVTFTHASEHQICATYDGRTGCVNVEVRRVGAPDTGFMAQVGKFGIGLAVAAAVAVAFAFALKRKPRRKMGLGGK